MTNITAVANPYQKDFNQIEKEIAELRDRNNQNPNNVQQNPEGAQQDTSVANTAATSEEEMTFKKRYVDLKTHYDKEISGARQQIKELEEKLTTSSQTTPPKTKEELEAYRQANPDMFAAMETMMNQNRGVSEDRVKELESQLAESRQEKAMNTIIESHADFYNIVASPEWDRWLEGQPSNVRSMVEGNTDNAPAFIRALDLYKLDAGMAQPTSTSSGSSSQKNTDTSAADAVVTTGASGVDVGSTNKRMWTASEIRSMPMSVYETMADEIMQARREGRVINDQ